MSLLDTVDKVFNTNDSCSLTGEESEKLNKTVKMIDKRVARLEKIILVGMLGLGALVFSGNLYNLPSKVSERIAIATKAYCKETNPAVRTVLIKLIRSEIPFYPETGLCADK